MYTQAVIRGIWNSQVFKQDWCCMIDQIDCLFLHLYPRASPLTHGPLTLHNIKGVMTDCFPAPHGASVQYVYSIYCDFTL